MAGWRYFATQLRGDGTETLLSGSLPLRDVQLSEVLSGVDDFTAVVPVEFDRLKGSRADWSLFVPWSTAIYAELDGEIRGGWIVVDADVDNGQLKLSGDGWVGYLHGMPYDDVMQFVNADPLEIAKHIWDHVQSRPHGNVNLRVVLDPPTSPIRVGKLPVDQWPVYHDGGKAPLLNEGSSFRIQYTDPKSKKVTTWYGAATRALSLDNTTSGTYYVRRRSDGVLSKLANPQGGVPSGSDVFGLASTKAPKTDEEDGETLEAYRLEWFADFDLGQRWDDLSDLGHFDYLVEHRWIPGTDDIEHILRVCYGGIGRRRDDLRFVVGENVAEVPQVEVRGAAYADTVIALGAGEGRAMVRGEWSMPTDRLRRPMIVTDKTLRTKEAADRAAAQRGSRVSPDLLGDVKQLVVRSHPNAPIGSFRPGDSVRLIGSGTGWAGDLDVWVRVLDLQMTPDAGDTMTCTVTRTERSAV